MAVGHFSHNIVVLSDIGSQVLGLKMMPGSKKKWLHGDVSAVHNGRLSVRLLDDNRRHRCSENRGRFVPVLTCHLPTCFSGSNKEARPRKVNEKQVYNDKYFHRWRLKMKHGGTASIA